VQDAEHDVPKKLRKLERKLLRAGAAQHAVVARAMPPGAGTGLAQRLTQPARPIPAPHVSLSSTSAKGGIIGRASVSALSAEEQNRRTERAQRFAATANDASASASPVRRLRFCCRRCNICMQNLELPLTCKENRYRNSRPSLIGANAAHVRVRRYDQDQHEPYCFLCRIKPAHASAR